MDVLYRDPLAHGFTPYKNQPQAAAGGNAVENARLISHNGQKVLKAAKITAKVPEGLDVRSSGTLFFTVAFFNE